MAAKSRSENKFPVVTICHINAFIVHRVLKRLQKGGKLRVLLKMYEFCPSDN